MKFKAGYLGACIIVISVLLGICGGFLLNVEQTPVNTTKYDYVTDITGLFNTTQQPQYIDYNPASNYTGYANVTPNLATAPTGITYTSTGTANNYRIIEELGSSSAGSSGTVNNSSPYATTTIYGGSYIDLGADSSIAVSYSNKVWLRDYKLTYLSTFLNTVFGDITAYSEIDLNLTYPTVHAPTQSAFIVFDKTEGLPMYGASYELLAGYPDRLEIDGTSGIFHAFWNDPNINVPEGYSVYNTYIAYGNCTQYEQGSALPGQVPPQASNSTSLSLSFTSNLTTAPEYAYMLPADGVTLQNQPGLSTYYGTIWDNDLDYIDYDNQRIDIIVGPQFVNGEFVPYTNSELWVYTFNGNGHYNVFKMYKGPTSYNVWLGYNNGGSDTVKATKSGLGTFNGIMLSLYADKIEMYGVIDFVNYQEVNVSPEPIWSSPTEINATLDNVKFYSEGTAPTFSVYNTKVFMNTYDSVMIDPSIDLADYWPDMDYYRYAFQSFAIYGDSITINNVIYPVTDGRVTIHNKTYDLNNVALSYSAQGRTSITFINQNKTIDLGPTVDKVVSFAGIWYFNAGLYEGYDTTELIYNWDFGDMMGHLDIVSFALLSLGLMVLCTLLCFASRITFKTMDKVVLLFGAIFLLILLGGVS